MINELMIEDKPISEVPKGSKVDRIFKELEKFEEVDDIHYMHEDWNLHEFDNHGISVREELSSAGFEKKLVSSVADYAFSNLKQDLLKMDGKVVLGKTRVFFKCNSFGLTEMVFLQEVEAVED